MRIVVRINHPGHFHTLKNIIQELINQGHEFTILLTKKDVSLELVQDSDIEFIDIGTYGNNYLTKLFKLFYYDYKIYKLVKDIQPDLFLGCGSITNAHVSSLLQKTCVNFDTNENQWEQHLLYAPFTDYILTPSCFTKSFGSKQIYYPGYQQLAYLHPMYFKPDTTVLDDLGLDAGDKIALFRLVSWQATHDVGEKGIGNLDKIINYLNKNDFHVFISSEREIEKHLEKYRLNLPANKFHSLLYYSSLIITEGATVAAESAILGTHAVYINTIKLGYISDIEKRYGLIKSVSPNDNIEKVINQIKKIVQTDGLFERGKEKRNVLLKDVVDIVQYVVNFINSLDERNAQKPSVNEW